MLDLEAFVSAVQTAVVEAARQVREHNLQMAYSAFDVVPPKPPEPPRPEPEPRKLGPGDPRATRTPPRHDDDDCDDGDGGKGGGGGGGGDGDAEGPPVLTPKLVAFQYPVDTADGPSVHTAYVPIASLIGTQQFAITEFKLNLKVAVATDGKQRLKLAFTGRPPNSAANRRKGAKADTDAELPADTEMGSIEIVIKSTEPASGYYEVLRGYDRALRADIPG